MEGGREKLALWFVICLNVLFAICGIVISSYGCAVKFGEEILGDDVAPLLQKISLADFSLGALVNGLTVLCISLGVVICCISAIGISGTWFGKKCLLFLYVAVVIAAVVAESCVLCFWIYLRQNITPWLNSEFGRILELYDGQRNSAITNAWDHLFILIQCCAVNAIEDKNDFEGSVWWSLPTRRSAQIPASCCVGATISTINKYSNSTCITSPTKSNSYIEVGCYQSISTALNSYIIVFITICCCLIVMQTAAIFLTFVMYKFTKQTGYSGNKMNFWINRPDKEEKDNCPFDQIPVLY